MEVFMMVPSLANNNASHVGPACMPAVSKSRYSTVAQESLGTAGRSDYPILGRVGRDSEISAKKAAVVEFLHFAIERLVANDPSAACQKYAKQIAKLREIFGKQQTQNPAVIIFFERYLDTLPKQILNVLFELSNEDLKWIIHAPSIWHFEGIDNLYELNRKIAKSSSHSLKEQNDLFSQAVTLNVAILAEKAVEPKNRSAEQLLALSELWKEQGNQVKADEFFAQHLATQKS